MEFDHLTPHPNPLPNPHHRKLDLQSPLDLTYIRDNVARAAREKLGLHFPVQINASRKGNGEPDRREGEGEGEEGGGVAEEPEEEDPMRARVSTLVNRFLDRTFEFARYSISVNGNDAHTSTLPPMIPNPDPSPTQTSQTTNAARDTPPSQDQDLEIEKEKEGTHFAYTPYDPRLSSKLASLYAELERETLAVSQLRRTAPSQGAEAWGGELLSVLAAEGEESDEMKKSKSRRRSGGNGEEDGEGLKLDTLPEGWNEDVRQMYERGLGGLRRLGGWDTTGTGRGGGGGGGGNNGVAAAGVSGGDGDGGGAFGAGASLTETLGKVQRARDVAMEFE